MANRPIRFLRPALARTDHPLFIFCPGMDGNGLLLHHQIPQLMAGFDICCLRISPHYCLSWDILVQETLNLIEAEIAKHQQPVYLCGESFGGCLALLISLQIPQSLERLILVNPASSFRALPWLQWGSHLTQYLPTPIYSLSALGLLPFLAALGRMSRQEIQKLRAAMQSLPQQTLIHRLELLRRFEIDPAQLKRLNLPTLILASGADRLLPSVTEAKRYVKELPQAKMIVLPHSGHACLLETDINLYELMQKVWSDEAGEQLTINN